MDRTTLVELADLNLFEASREMARRAGGVVLDEDGLLLIAGAHPLPVLCNIVFRTGDGPASAEVLARADAFFGARGRGYTIMARAHADGDLEQAAEAAGLKRYGNSPAMVLEHRLAEAVPPPGVELRRVATAGDARDFAVVNGRAYATYGMPEDVGPAVLGPPAVTIGPHIAAFVAYLDGAPGAAAMTIVAHGVAGIYWVGTVPEARGRGLAELVTRAAGNAGFDLGARVTALQASVMGEPVYRRMGYVEVSRYPQLVRSRPRR